MITANYVMHLYYYNQLKAYLLFNPLSFYEDIHLKSGFFMFVDIGTTSKCNWLLVLFVSKMFLF